MSDFNAALAEAIPLIQRMLGVFVVFGITIYFLICGQTSISKGSGHYLPDKNNMAKREFEIFALKYTVIWIAIFGVVVAFELYKQFTSNTYMIFLVSVASPYLLQPFLYPMPSEKNLPTKTKALDDTPLIITHKDFPSHHTTFQICKSI